MRAGFGLPFLYQLPCSSAGLGRNVLPLPLCGLETFSIYVQYLEDLSKAFCPASGGRRPTLEPAAGLGCAIWCSAIQLGQCASLANSARVGEMWAVVGVPGAMDWAECLHS